MKAIQVTHLAESGNLAFATDLPMPQLDASSSDLLIKVQACALNPGDCRIMGGSVSLVFKPKTFPYTPGMDICGIVEDVGAKCTTFHKGDRVVVVLGPIEKYGGLAEFLVCDAKRATLAPANLTPLQAASMPIAGTTALQALKDARVQAGSKIVVLGASGGVGSLVVQIAKLMGASHVATTSTNATLVKSLGADHVIDYRTNKWWEVLESDGKHKFDAIIDCVGCDESWANCDRVLARKGRYVAVVDGPETKIQSVGDLLRFAGRILPRVLNPFTTSYKLVNCFPMGEDVKPVLDMAQEGKLHAVMDPQSPFEFSLAGVEQAVAIQNSHRAKGKLVVHISS